MRASRRLRAVAGRLLWWALAAGAAVAPPLLADTPPDLDPAAPVAPRAAAIAQVELASTPTDIVVRLDQDGTLARIGSLRLPPGWALLASQTWHLDSGCFAQVAQTTVTAQAADDSAALTYGPTTAWVLAGTERDVEACPVASARDLRTYLVQLARAEHADAEVLDQQALPEQARALRQQVEGDAPAPAPGVTHGYEAWRMLFAWRTEGRPMREVRSAALAWTRGPDGNTVLYVPSVLSYRAPAGQLDLALPDRVAATLQMRPEWHAYVGARTDAALARYAQTPRGRQAAAIDAAVTAAAAQTTSGPAQIP